jgi:hypothetical protein
LKTIFFWLGEVDSLEKTKFQLGIMI